MLALESDSSVVEYVYACQTTDLQPGSMKVLEGVDRVPTCLINSGGKFFAVSGVCPHKGASLWEGELKDGYIICPFHAARFRVEDGRNSWPAPRGLRTFPVKVEGTSLFVGKRNVESQPLKRREA